MNPPTGSQTPPQGPRPFPSGAATADEGPQSRKRLFIGLILGASLLLCLTFVLLWFVPYLGLKAIHPVAPAIWGILMAGAIAITLWASVGLVLNVLTGRTLPFLKRLRGVTVKLFLPLMILVGRAIGISKERIRNSFIKVNNDLVCAETRTYRPEQIMLLMPHCLQSSTCDRRLTYNTDNCTRCGRCPIKGLLELRDVYGVHLAIATGGTIARRIVVQKRPRLILAVACERDLAEGIQDTFPLPVFGVLNLRPHGPCLDTLIPFQALEDALRRFLDPKALLDIDARRAARKNNARGKATPDGGPTLAAGDSAVPGQPALSDTRQD